MEPSLSSLLDFARQIAEEAGQLLMQGRSQLQSADVETKSSARDLVTQVDRDCESFLVSKIQSRFPKDEILAEEGGLRPGANTTSWCIDPLDGTVNFVQGLPFFSVSIARISNGKPDLAVVHLPVLKETFFATLGGGAYLNESSIRVSSKTETMDSVLATGFPYRRNELAENNLENFNRMFLQVRGIRRMGSAAIDLAYVAAGKLDAFWELHLSPWDVAAGALLVTEAHGTVDTIVPGGDWLHEKNILAGPSQLVDEVREILLRGREPDYPNLGDLDAAEKKE